MAYVQAPLKKVLYGELKQVDFKASERRGTVSLRWKYDRVWTLECGHTVTTPSYIADRRRMRCYECKNGFAS